MTESHVQLNVEGTGPEVRTLEVVTHEQATDGSPTETDVHQQVVTLADRLGRLIDDDDDWREAMLIESRKQTEWLEIIAEAVMPGSG
jgi:hypothetical protein